MDYKLFIEMISGLYQLGTRNNTLEKHKERDDFFYRETLIFLLDIEKVGRLICENGGRENYRIESYLNVIEQQLEQKWLFESLFFLKKNKNIHARYVKCFYEALDKTIKDFGNLVKSGNRDAIKTLFEYLRRIVKALKLKVFSQRIRKKIIQKLRRI